MNLDELKDLKDGDRVLLNQLHSGVKAGTILTRDKNWMDDDLCSKFRYGEGISDFHFFSHDQVDFIKE